MMQPWELARRSRRAKEALCAHLMERTAHGYLKDTPDKGAALILPIF